jgi:hypothetical protein
MVHFLQHLERFFSSLLSSREFWAAMLGGLFVLAGQQMANRAQRSRDQEADRDAVNGALQAIVAELKVLKSNSFDQLERTLKDHAARCQEAKRNGSSPPPPLAMGRTEQNRVIVFQSNAGTLGRIKNGELRMKIIRVYGLIAGLADTLNDYALNFERWRALPDLRPQLHPEKQIVIGTLEQIEAGLLKGFGVLQGELSELLPKIEEYLDL